MKMWQNMEGEWECLPKSGDSLFMGEVLTGTNTCITCDCSSLEIVTCAYNQCLTVCWKREIRMKIHISGVHIFLMKSSLLLPMISASSIHIQCINFQIKESLAHV